MPQGHFVEDGDTCFNLGLWLYKQRIDWNNGNLCTEHLELLQSLVADKKLDRAQHSERPASEDSDTAGGRAKRRRTKKT